MQWQSSPSLNSPGIQLVQVSVVPAQVKQWSVQGGQTGSSISKYSALQAQLGPSLLVSGKHS